MAKVHERILEIVGVADDSSESFTVSAVNYYRSEAELNASTPFVMTYTQDQVTSPSNLILGEVLPPPTRIRLNFTVVA